MACGWTVLTGCQSIQIAGMKKIIHQSKKRSVLILKMIRGHATADKVVWRAKSRKDRSSSLPPGSDADGRRHQRIPHRHT